jgi:uncharacterized integral membrane protein
MLDDEERRRRGEGPPDQATGPAARAAEARRDDEAHLRELSRARQKRVAKAVVILVIVLALIIFIVSNSDSVPVSFASFHWGIRMIWVMIGCALAGAIVGYLIGRPGRQVRFHRPRDDDPGSGTRRRRDG